MSTSLSLEMVRAWLPARPEAAHKGTFGHVFILAGSAGFTGAGRLAAESAGRSGAGLVTLGIPEPLVPVMAPALLEAMWVSLPATKQGSFSSGAVTPALTAAKKKGAVVLGPGISTHEETRRFVLEFIRHVQAPLLVDADGLNAVSINPGVIATATVPLVVTPHPGEMARLSNISTEHVQRDRMTVAAQFAARQKCIVVLKGAHTIVAGPEGECFVNPTGNAGLATGGTGDVLSGLIGGLLAQGIGPLHAACIGVYAHGLAGDIAAGEMTQRGMIAGDVVRALPRAWRAIEGN